jgi:hypothetical protein
MPHSHRDDATNAAAVTHNRPGTYSLRTLFIVTAVIALILGLIVAAQRALEPNRGPVEDRNEWPAPLYKVLAAVGSADLDIEPVRVYRIQSFMDRHYYWKLRGSPELIQLMVSQWGLRPGTSNDVSHFWNRWPDDWETVDRNGRLSWLANYGNKSDNYIVMIDGDVVYVYYYFNF